MMTSTIGFRASAIFAFHRAANLQNRDEPAVAGKAAASIGAALRFTAQVRF
jgi:hypothetical protein